MKETRKLELMDLRQSLFLILVVNGCHDCSLSRMPKYDIHKHMILKIEKN